MRSYAQNCEDLVLKTLLPHKKGFYVDVGANLPDNDSVTKLFYLNGWRGINIEPIPELYRQLCERRGKDLNINVGIAAMNGSLRLRQYHDGNHGLSTFSKSMQDSDSNGRSLIPYEEYSVPVRTLKSIFEEYKVKTIDFLKVDVEGLEYEVLQSNDWEKWKPKVVVIENTPGKWTSYMLELGYIEVFFDGLNRYYATPEVHAGLGLVLSKYHSLTTREVDGNYDLAAQELKRQLEDRDALLRAVRDKPEDHISFRKLCKAVVKQIQRRLSIIDSDNVLKHSIVDSAEIEASTLQK